MIDSENIKESIAGMYTNTGESVAAISQQFPVMLVFLRHFGCTFCREALSEIALNRKEIEQNGTKLIFIHMADEATANRYFIRYNLEGAVHICDPDCQYYADFGLVKGTTNQLMGLRVWMRGFEAGIIGGHGIGRLMGDSFQMPGIFLIQNGVIKDHYIHKLSSDKPDYQKLTECCQV